MIKTLSIEQKFYDRCLNQKGTNFGLVIGGSVKDDECVFLLLTSSEKDTVSLDSITTSGIRSECQKICRMLPAGPRVSGAYFCGPLNVNKSGNRIKEILYIIHQAEKHPLADKFSEISGRDKVFLHADPVSKIVTAKAIGFDHPKDFLRPVDVKVRPVVDRWRAIKTNINLTLDSYLPAERQKDKIFQELQKAVTPFLESINSKTRLLIDGDYKKDSDPLFSKKSQDKASRHSKRQRDAKVNSEAESPSERTKPSDGIWDPTNFNLFAPEFIYWSRSNSSSSIDSGHCSDSVATTNTAVDRPARGEGDKNLTIRGRIPGLAFLPVEGTTVADALKAFQRDLTHSILLRLELLTEELQISCGELECSRILLPSRVLVRIPACPSCPLCDYKFISETPEDVVRRVALFCRPLGSSEPVAEGTAGEASSDSDFNDEDEEETSDLVVLVPAGGGDGEPVFDAACLDTDLERTFDADASDNDLSDVDIINDMEEMPPPVSQSKGRTLLLRGALVCLLLSILVAIYLELLPL